MSGLSHVCFCLICHAWFVWSGLSIDALDVNPVAEFERYYKILEIAPGASLAEVKRAYRLMARKWHPDRFTNLEDKAIAEVRFKQIHLAYEQLTDYVLSDPQADRKSSPIASPAEPRSSRPYSAPTPPTDNQPSPPPSVTTQAKSPQLLYQMAADYARAENYEAAIACLSSAIQCQPDYAAAYRYRGHLRSLLSLERAATADLQKADQLERQLPRAAHPVPAATPPTPHTVLSPGQLRLQQRGPITAMALRSDAGLLVSGNRAGTLFLWDLATAQLCAEVSAHVGQVTGLVAIERFGQLGRRLISTGADGQLHCWRLYAGPWGRPRLVRRQTLTAHDGAVSAVSAQSKRLITAGVDGCLKSWQLDWRGRLHCIEQIPAHTGEVTAVALRPDGDLVVSGGQDGLTYLWRLSMHVCLGSLPRKASAASAAAFSPQGQLVAIGEDSGWIQILRVTGEPGQISVEATLPAHHGAVRSLCWLSEHQLLTTGTDHAIRVWSMPSPQPQVAIVDLVSNVLSLTCLNPTTCLYGTETGGLFQPALEYR